MSYEMLLKETQALSYAEQVDLMAYLANSIQAQAVREDNAVQQKLEALESVFGILSPDEAAAVEESISGGITFEELNL
ncbi:MAG: hypothetical protein NC219_10630 [Prevotella sp.]|nr:hypothetical protein [Prevotella sp.]